jgi:putative ABC transport system ATP-binding protein
MKLLKRYNEKGQTILMVTHDASIASQTDRVLHLVDGRMAGEG